MNVKELAEDLGLEEDEYLELIELFIEASRSDLDRLQTAIEEGDPEQAANAAHSIKGAGGNLVLMEVYELAKAIEDKARHDQMEKIEESVQVLRSKLDLIAGLSNA